MATIAGLATPVVLGQLSQTLMGLVDTLMVGRLGAVSLAAVAVATLMFSALAMSLKAMDVAVQSFAARRVGQGREDEVGAVLTTALLVTSSVGAVLMVVGLMWPEAMMRLASRDPAVQELGSQYLVHRYAGILPLLWFFQAKAMFDGIGWTRVGMGVGIGMNLANVVLNWMLIYGHWGAPALGAAGAALASTISACLAAAAMFAVMVHPPNRRRFRLIRRGNFQRQLIKPFLRLAWPPAVQTLGIVVGLIVFHGVLGLIGTVQVAAGNIVLRLASLSFMPGVGVGAAVQTLVGQSLGRGDPRGARRATVGGVGLSMMLMGLLGLTFVLWPGGWLRLFSDRSQLIAAGMPILRLTGLVQLIVAVGLTLSGALRGAGLTRAVMLVDVGTGFVLLPPMSYLFGVVWGRGLWGAWLALVVWFSMYALGMVVLFQRSKWETVQL